MTTKNKPLETRGRPKKEQHRTLDPKYKKLFSQNTAVACSCCLIYVFQVFVETKSERRVGHKDGGYTMFQKISSEYSFDSFQSDLEEWGYSELLHIQCLRPFLFQLPALGPKIILREVIKFIKYIIDEGTSEGVSPQNIEETLTNESFANKQFKHMRFSPTTLQELKMDRLEKSERVTFLELIGQRVSKLWRPFIKIMVYTVLNALDDNVQNKYYKPFFSDAENPQETYIGQLNLPQIVKSVQKYEEYQNIRERAMYHSNTKVYKTENIPLVVLQQPPIRLPTTGLSQEREIKKEQNNENQSQSEFSNEREVDPTEFVKKQIKSTGFSRFPMLPPTDIPLENIDQLNVKKNGESGKRVREVDEGEVEYGNTMKKISVTGDRQNEKRQVSGDQEKNKNQPNKQECRNEEIV